MTENQKLVNLTNYYRHCAGIQTVQKIDLALESTLNYTAT